MVVYGKHDRISLPDDEEVIWYGDLQWCNDDGNTPSIEIFDWLVDYFIDTPVYASVANHKTRGDALFAPSAMNGIGSDAKRASYIEALIRCMSPAEHYQVQFAAGRAISEARGELSSIASDSMLPGAQLLELFSKLLDVVGSPASDDSKLDLGQTRCYLRFIFSLAKNVEWLRLLPVTKREHPHVEKCTVLSQRFHVDEEICYIVGIYLHIDTAGNIPLGYTQESWGTLIMCAWAGWAHIHADKDFDHCIEISPILVRATEIFKTSANFKLEDLARDVDRVLRTLEWHVNVGNEALSEVQRFSDSLKSELELADKIREFLTL